LRATLAAVASGNVDAGIVYRTDAPVSKKVEIAFEVPAAAGPAISYPFALVKRAPPEAAEVAALADEVVFLDSGRIRACGAPRDVLRDRP
jgi:ABC-type molybdate transport system substrate-binding protein